MSRPQILLMLILIMANMGPLMGQSAHRQNLEKLLQKHPHWQWSHHYERTHNDTLYTMIDSQESQGVQMHVHFIRRLNGMLSGAVSFTFSQADTLAFLRKDKDTQLLYVQLRFDNGPLYEAILEAEKNSKNYNLVLSSFFSPTGPRPRPFYYQLRDDNHQKLTLTVSTSTVSPSRGAPIQATFSIGGVGEFWHAMHAYLPPVLVH